MNASYRRFDFAPARSGASLRQDTNPLPDMTRKQICRAIAPTRLRALVSLTLALLFAFQGFLVNTHIHSFASQPDRSSLVHVATPANPSAPDHGRTPGSDAACALCLAAALAGVFTQFSPAVLPQPAQYALLERMPLDQRPIVLVPHRAWQSRAPPVA